MSEPEDHLTPAGRKAIEMAEAEAIRLGHRVIGTEHLLLGILDDESNSVALVLAAHGVAAAVVRHRVLELVGPGQRPSAEPEIAPTLVDLLNSAEDHAARLGHRFLGVEHMLLAMLDDEDSIAGRVLHELGMTLRQVRSTLVKLGGGDVTAMDMDRQWRPLPERQAGFLPGGEIAQVRELIEQGAELVEICGAPGSGTTTLIKYLASLVVQMFPGGVVLDLADGRYGSLAPAGNFIWIVDSGVTIPAEWQDGQRLKTIVRVLAEDADRSTQNTVEMVRFDTRRTVALLIQSGVDGAALADSLLDDDRLSTPAAVKSLGELLARNPESVSAGSLDELVVGLFARMRTPEAIVCRRITALGGVAYEGDLERITQDCLDPADVSKAVSDLIARRVLHEGGKATRLCPLLLPHAAERLQADEAVDSLALLRERVSMLTKLRNGSRPEPRLLRDFWTTEDELSYTHYSDAIASFIRHRDTEPPLTIAVKAPWGAGKTSLMRMVQDHLDPGAGEPGRARPLRLVRRSAQRASASSDDNTLTNAELYKRSWFRRSRRGTSDAGVSAELASSDDLILEDWRPTVWFNPWTYQSSEQVWAGLATAVIEQLSGRLPRAQRERFWFALNRARVHGSAIRRQVYRAMAERLPLLTVGVCVVLGVIVSLLASQLPLAVRALGLGSPLIGAGVLVAAAIRFLKAPVAGLNAALLAPVTAGMRPAGSTALEVYEKAYSDPDYRAKLGFLHVARKDMGNVLDLVATRDRPVVVFIDDLDRCSPRTVRDVVEALNDFVTGTFPNCIFVIGMDPHVVAAHIESGYTSVIDVMKGQRVSTDATEIGWRFLDKFIQLPISLPEPDREKAISGYVKSLLGDRSDVTGDRQPASAETPVNPQLFRRLVERIEKQNPTPETLRAAMLEAQSAEMGQVDGTLPVALKAADEVFARMRSSADERAVLKAALSILDSANPREIKRFINLFRFYSFIAYRIGLDGKARPPGDVIAKLTVFALRWPDLMSTIRRNTGQAQHPIAALEEAAQSRDANEWIGALTAAGVVVEDVQPPWCVSLRDFLRQQPSVADSAHLLL